LEIRFKSIEDVYTRNRKQITARDLCTKISAFRMKTPNIYIHESCKNALITSLKWTDGVHYQRGQ